MDTTEIPTPQPGCDGDPLTSITEHWADLLGCTKSMCAVMRAFNSSIDIGYAPMGLGEQVWAELTTLGNLVDAARISITPAIVASGRWKTEGSKSPEDWLAGKTGSSTGKARTQLETGKNLRKAPGTQESFLNGEISAEQADTIADAVEANPAAEDDLLNQAKRDSLKNLKDEAARRKAEVEDIEERERRLHRKRYVRQWTDKEGAWNLRARGPIPTGSEFMAVLEGLIDQQFKKARKSGVRGTRDNYAYDALMDLANQHGWGHGTGNSGGNGGTGGDSGSGGGSSGGTGGGSGGMGSGTGGYGSGTGSGTGGIRGGTGNPTKADGSGSRGHGNRADGSSASSPGGPTRGRRAQKRTGSGDPAPGFSGRADSGQDGGPRRAQNADPFEPDENENESKRECDCETGFAEVAGSPTSDPGPTNTSSPTSEPGPELSETFEGRLFDLEPASDNFGDPPEQERQPQPMSEGRTQAKPAKQRIFCIDWSALARGRIHPGERCELRGVGMVSVRAIRHALRSGTARMVITDTDDRVVTVALIGTGATNGRLFPMGTGNELKLEHDPDRADRDASTARSTVIVRVRVADLTEPVGATRPMLDVQESKTGDRRRAADQPGATRPTIEVARFGTDGRSRPTGQRGGTGRIIDVAGIGTVDGYRLADLLGDELAGRLIDRGQAVRSLTHAGRAPSTAQRVALAWADTTCSVPGCHNQRVEIDHRHPWAADRVTELDNLDPLCGHHHDLKTHQGWAFTATAGRARRFVGPNDPAHPDADDGVARWLGPNVARGIERSNRSADSA